MGRRKLAAMGVLMSVVVAGCTGRATPSRTLPVSSGQAPPTATLSAPARGGEATLGVEHWPECLNPVLSCAQPETYQSVLYHVLPRAMQFAPDGSLVASPLLAEAPTLDNGGLTQAPFTVRFRLSDQAVWDDGTPITAEDFAFTWRAILHTRDAVDVDRYQRILAIDTTDPRSPVLRLDEPWAGWTELFGGSNGFVLKRAAFPDAAPEAPSLRRDMLSDIPFSGGPFRLAEWVGDQAALTDDRAVLERNDRYYGPQALLDRVTFVPWQDLNSEMQTFTGGDQDAMFLSAADLAISGTFPFGLLDSPYIASTGGDSTSFEALWFNAHERPLMNPLVREALMYAIDRERVVEALVTGNNSRAQVLNCGFLALPGEAGGCRTTPFERFTYDPTRSLRLLEEAGYDCSSKPCTKSGKPLEVRYVTSAVNRLQSLTEEMLIDAAKPAGFDIKPENIEGGVLFQAACPFARIAVTGCAAPSTPGASPTPRFSCDAIPTQSNDFQGSNRIAWCNSEANRLMKESDRQLDPARRAALLDRVYQLQADDMIGLPLYVIPTVVAWRDDRLAGPIDAYLSSPYGPFFNVSEWYRAEP